MKKVLLIILFFSSIYASNIENFSSKMNYLRDYKEALKIAKKENKPLMLVGVTDYCPWCRKFERKTLENTKVSMEIKNNFVPLIVDKRRDKDAYPQKFSLPITPNVFFINPKDESIISKSVGYIKKNDYLEKLESVLYLYSSEDK